MANYLEVMGPGPSRITLNINQIVSIKATTPGCLIQLTEGESFTIKTPYKDVKKALKQASNTFSFIHSIVSDDLADATPPPPITVG